MIRSVAPRFVSESSSTSTADAEGSANHAVSDRAWLLLRLARTGRDVLSYTVSGERNVVLNQPDLVKHVLVTNRSNYTKDTRPNRLFKTTMAGGVLTADGAEWRHQRSVLGPVFRRMQRVAEVARDCVELAVTRFDRAADAGEPVNLSAEMARTTLSITTLALFGFGHERFIDHCADLGVLLDGALSMLPPDGSTGVRGPRAGLFDSVREAVAALDPDEHGPALAAVLADPGHSDEAVAHQIVTLLLAGYETTANSLTWAWILLCQNTSSYREWQSALAGSDQGAVWTKAVFDEAVRLYPAAWMIGRRAIGDDAVGGVHIPAGAAVAISPFLLHRHPRYWPDPDRFEPARFLPGGGGFAHRYAYIPFGAGPRVCLGSAHAAIEAHLILSELGRRYTFHPLDSDARPEHKYVLRAPDPYPVIVRRR